jgi:hypothetical protein
VQPDDAPEVADGGEVMGKRASTQRGGGSASFHRDRLADEELRLTAVQNG